MRKQFLFLFALIFIGLPFASAQKLRMEELKVAYYQMPKNTDYVNYKTYSLYACYPNSDYGIDGLYYPFDDEILKYNDNGDFKFIVEIVSMTKVGLKTGKDSTAMVCEDAILNINAFDKAGTCFYTRKVSTGLRSATIAGKAEGKGDLVFKRKLAKALVEEILPGALKGFEADYLVSLVAEKPTLAMATLWGGGKNEKATELYDNTMKIVAVKTPEALTEEAKKQLPHWKSLTALEDTKENKDWRFCGFYNTAVLSYFTGNVSESDQYLAKAEEIKGNHEKYMVRDFRDLKTKNVPDPSAFAKPDVSAIKAKHDAGMASTMNMETAIDNYKYFIITGVVTLKDGAAIEGKIRISRRDDAKEGNIVSLSGGKYAVTIEKADGGKSETELSKIEKIEDAQSTYLCSSSSIKQSVYRSDKVSLYRTVFPEMTNYYEYQKGNEKPGSPSLFGPTKWLKKFFADCPELVQKIDDKTIKEPLDMVKMYNEGCK